MRHIHELRGVGGRVRPSKYKAVALVVEGIRFASKLEARRYEELRLMERLGGIEQLRIHPHYDLEVNRVKIGRGYTADFAYYDCDLGRTVVEDVKGISPRDWPLRRDLMLALHGIRVELWPPRKRKGRGGENCG